MYCIWDDKDEIVFCMFFFFFRSAITLGLYTPNELNQTPLPNAVHTQWDCGLEISKIRKHVTHLLRVGGSTGL